MPTQKLWKAWLRWPLLIWRAYFRFKVLDMTSDNTQETLSVQIANQIINIANDRHKDGSSVDEIAAGLRHAAANFSAFAYFRSEKKGLYSNAIADEFVNLLTQYLESHRRTEQPAQGLSQLKDQAKNGV